MATQQENYSYALVNFMDTDVKVEDFSYTLSVDTEEKYSIDSPYPYKVKIGQEKVELSLDNVDNDYLELFNRAKASQRGNINNLPTLALYDLDFETGKIREHKVFIDCLIEKIDYKGKDLAFSVSMKALKTQEKTMRS